MGDRCYFTVWVRNIDAESEKGSSILADYGLEPVEEEEQPMNWQGGLVSGWVDDQMNYGGADFLEDWKEAGFPCDGDQEGGDDYGPSHFFIRKGELFEFNTARSGGFVIDFDSETGEPSEHDLAAVKEFILEAKANDEEMKRGPLEDLAATHNTNTDEEQA